jgi:hypothetical protein
MSPRSQKRLSGGTEFQVDGAETPIAPARRFLRRLCPALQAVDITKKETCS